MRHCETTDERRDIQFAIGPGVRSQQGAVWQGRAGQGNRGGRKGAWLSAECLRQVNGIAEQRATATTTTTTTAGLVK